MFRRLSRSRLGSETPTRLAIAKPCRGTEALTPNRGYPSRTRSANRASAIVEHDLPKLFYAKIFRLANWYRSIFADLSTEQSFTKIDASRRDHLIGLRQQNSAQALAPWRLENLQIGDRCPLERNGSVG